MRKLLKVLFWFLLIVIILVVAIYLTAGIWIRSAVSNLLPQITQTEASLGGADISIFSGKIILKDFKISNPAVFLKPNAFEFKEIFVRFEPTSLLKDKIIINEIKVDGTKITAELAKSGDMNLMVLNNNVQKYLGNPVPTQLGVEKQPVVSSKQTDASGKTVIIKDLEIVNSALQLALLSNEREIKLPSIHETNIGEKKKATLEKLIADVFSKLIEVSFVQISKSGKEAVNTMLDNLTSRTKSAAPLQNLTKQFF